MAYSDEDQIVSAGLPYFRVVQPKSATAAFTDSTYLRLGSYVAGADQEDALLTGLTTTTSSVETGSESARTQADANIANAKGDPAKQYSATSQATATYATKPSAAIASANAGALLYTDGDLHENVKGAALQKFGKGHVVEVTTADAKYGVTAGKLDIGAKNGIFVKAGSFTAGAEANVNTIDQRANLELTATGYIKQTAYGPLDEVTYGVTRKNFHGEAYDEFHGFKETIFRGREHVYKMSGVMSMTMSGEVVLKLSTKFELTAGVDTGIRLALDFKVFIGAKMDVVLIWDLKMVAGWSTKLVGGPDYKAAVSDTKTLATSDTKIAPVADMKHVGLNITICSFDYKKQLLKADDAMCLWLKSDLDAHFKGVKVTKSALDTKISGLTNFL